MSVRRIWSVAMLSALVVGAAALHAQAGAKIVLVTVTNNSGTRVVFVSWSSTAGSHVQTGYLDHGKSQTIRIPTDWRINGVWDTNTPRPRESRSGWGKAYK